MRLVRRSIASFRPQLSGGTGEWKLFEVAKDPCEAKDLSADMPDKLETLKAAWDRYAREVGVILLE